MNHPEWWGSAEAQALYWGGTDADDAGLAPKIGWTRQHATNRILVPLATFKDDDPDRPRKFAAAWRRWRERGATPADRRAAGALRVPYDFAGAPDAAGALRAAYAPIVRVGRLTR